MYEPKAGLSLQEKCTVKFLFINSVLISSLGYQDSYIKSGDDLTN